MNTIVDTYLKDKIFFIISDTAAMMGVRAFVIGGYVRDCFLGRKTDDIDIVVEGSGIELATAVSKKIRETEKKTCKVSYFKNFGTAMLKYHGMEIEFVGARKESYSEDSRKPSVENGTLEDDQKRRDFTINAMAFSLQKEDFGALIDPFGGIKDLAAGIIRTPLDPHATYSDDPLRMLRAIRFATKLSDGNRNFVIVPESLKAMSDMKERMKILSKERIVEELNKILITPKPSLGLRILEQTGLLQYVLPDLELLKGVETVEGRGHKDNFSHTIQVVDNVAEEEALAIKEGRIYNYNRDFDGSGTVKELRTEPNVWLRWAALLHDIGKPKSKKYVQGVGWTFHGHDVIGAKMVYKIFLDMKMPMNDKMKFVQKLVFLHHRPVALVDDGVSDSAVRRLLFDAGDEIDDLMLLCGADITSKNPLKVAKIKQNFEKVKLKLIEVEAKDAIRNWKNPITGEFLMEKFGIPPGRTIGELKETVKNAILDGIIPNTFEAAENFVEQKAVEFGLEIKNAD